MTFPHIVVENWLLSVHRWHIEQLERDCLVARVMTHPSDWHCLEIVEIWPPPEMDVNGVLWPNRHVACRWPR